MLFNSIQFFVFLSIVLLGYAASRNSVRTQNMLLLVGSYVFYGSWDWRFLSLILLSTVVDYFVGRQIFLTENEKKRKYLLFLSVFVNLSILGFFKYFNFFADSLVDFASTFGLSVDYPTLNVILPVGISFYTFQTMSYTLDICRNELRPTRRFVDFALFVAFFPQLVAGPIERAKNLLPQITRPRAISRRGIHAGLFLISWGLFKKVVIADNVATISDNVFAEYYLFHGIDLIVGILAFTVQIYCDFSGYSDIARGICKLMGFELMVNFRLPYFANSPSDFWRRWHISLSTWLRDYLYISLGGNRASNMKTMRNLLLTMILGGLWHGASWNFVIWGFFHGTILVLYRLADIYTPAISIRSSSSQLIPALSVPFMFLLTCIGWVIFRSPTAEQIVYMIFESTHITSTVNWRAAYELAFFSLPLVLMQLWQHKTRDLLIAPKSSPLVAGTIYGLLVFGIIVFGVRDSMEFIYFQF